MTATSMTRMDFDYGDLRFDATQAKKRKCDCVAVLYQAVNTGLLEAAFDDESIAVEASSVFSVFIEQPR